MPSRAGLRAPYSDTVTQHRETTRMKTEVASRGRPSWSGVLRFGLVAFPVDAFNAHLDKAGAVQFHQLHRTCHRRIRYEV